MNRYSCNADDFYVNVNLNTEMELPNNRDTVLHFFEQMKKGFPELRNFYTRENGDLVLEGDKEQESYRWLAIEPRRLCSVVQLSRLELRRPRMRARRSSNFAAPSMPA